MSTVYFYKEATSEDRKSISIKGSKLYYIENNDSCSIEAVGYTEFAKPKKNKDSILIDSKTYYVRELKKNDKITGYLKVEGDKYIAFHKEGILGMLLIFLIWLAIMLAYLLCRDNSDDSGGVDDIPPKIPFDNVELEYVLPDGVIVGGEEGTDVRLVPELETEYAAYWGYQSITITEGMIVPFVNKETNEHYIVFVIYDKEGNVIESSDYIPPGSHFEWDAYGYYGGVPGEYFHDIRIIWCKPVYDNGEIVKFEAGTASPRTPDFKVTIK